jgi:indole-3-glycerol phosphate synthase
MTILEKIFAHKQDEIAERKRACSPAEIRRKAEASVPALDFIAALRTHPQGWPALIAEIKHASPSRGQLVEDFDPLALAQMYQENGAAAISVLTDKQYFAGSLEYLRQVAALPGRPPLMCKDFICDSYQVYEAREAGADSVLLIAAHLELDLLKDLHALARQLGMAALVEVHNREEIERALKISPPLVGINNRDLRDFSVRLETTLLLRPDLPPETCVVAESGIHSAEDVRRLAMTGIDAILVGEALVTAVSPAAQVRSLARPVSREKGLGNG